MVFFGSVVWSNSDETIYQYGNPGDIFPRSILKPLQIRAIIRDLDLDEKQLALSVASPNGEPHQLALLKTMLAEEQHCLLHTPKCLPLQFFSRVRPHKPSRFFHPCCGKHLGIIRALLNQKIDVSGYTQPSHPYHGMFCQSLEDYLPGRKLSFWAKDGCGLPSPAMRLEELARIYAKLGERKDENGLWQAATRHPFLLGGYKRADSIVIHSNKGKVFAKEGADGLMALAIPHAFDRPLGVAIKLAGGWNTQVLWTLSSAIIQSLGLKVAPPPKLDRQEYQILEEIFPKELRGNKVGLKENWDQYTDDGWRASERN